MKSAFLALLVGVSLVTSLSAQAECGGGTVAGTVGGAVAGRIIGGRGLSGLVLGAAGAAAGNHIQKKHNQMDCEMQAPAGYVQGTPVTPVPAGTGAGLFINQAGVQFKCYKEAGPAGTQVNVCMNGETVINVDSAYVKYTMQCFSQNSYTKRISPSPVGSPFEQASLQTMAMQICRGITPRGQCLPATCNYVP